MNKLMLSVLVMGMTAGLALAAEVQAGERGIHERTHYPYVTAPAINRINHLQHRQQADIRQGLRNGSLTPQEARRLQAEQRSIAARERAYRADGVLTVAEHRDLYGALHRAERRIYNQMHDADRRY